MLFVCEVEKQRNIIHVGVSVARNFLHLEGQAALRSSGIDAAGIWYLVFLVWFFSRVGIINQCLAKTYGGGDIQATQLVR